MFKEENTRRQQKANGMAMNQRENIVRSDIENTSTKMGHPT
jgi:hypothetical protein